MDPRIIRGIDLFNDRRFFEAHEALEEVWLGEHGEEKRALQGLIQVAAAFHHHSRANRQGFQSLLAKGVEKLGACSDDALGIHCGSLRNQLRSWREFLSASETGHPISPPPLPRITYGAASPPLRRRARLHRFGRPL